MPRAAEDGDDPSAPQDNARIFNAPPVVIGTIAVLAAIHVLRMFAGEDWEVWTLYAFSLLPARFGGPEPVPMIAGSQWWSFLTYAFLHADWLHLGLNSLWLLVFGTPVARWYGSARFLVISALSAIGGALAMVISNWGSPVPVIGASAAVSGLMAAAIPVMYGHHGRPLFPDELMHDKRALMFVVMWLGITLLTGAQGYIDSGGIRIAWEAHIGGFVTGFVVYALMLHGRVRR